MSTNTLVGTPDRDPLVPMPSPGTCTCIYAARTSGPFGVKMELQHVGDPKCPRHRKVQLPALIGRLDRITAAFTPRHKLA